MWSPLSLFEELEKGTCVWLSTFFYQSSVHPHCCLSSTPVISSPALALPWLPLSPPHESAQRCNSFLQPTVWGRDFSSPLSGHSPILHGIIWIGITVFRCH